MTIRDHYEKEEDFEKKFYPPNKAASKEASPNYAGLIKCERAAEGAAVSVDTAGGEVVPERSQMQATVFDPGFLQWYLNRNIGKSVRVEYLVGTSILTDRVGTIDEVGVSYLILRDQAGERILTDLYSIKFITFYN